MSIGVVLGTRPEIIKLASVIEALDREALDHCLIHTNQHYDRELDARFFEELELEPAEVNLRVGSGSHGRQTAMMLELIEAEVESRRLDHVIVQGDTNSGLAGALAAAKMPCTVSHVEAGLRSFDLRMPEEINRRLIDHLADELFPPTDRAAEELRKESVPGHVHPAFGNTVVDAVLRYAGRRDVPAEERGGYVLMTLHRPENVDDPATLEEMLGAVATVAEEHDLDVVFPAHPRTVRRIEEHGLKLPARIEAGEPKGFRELLDLQAGANVVMTDSGGLQEESCVLGTPSVVMRRTTDRPETVAVGASILAGVSAAGIIEAGGDAIARAGTSWAQPFGDGRSGERIVASIASR